MRFLTDQDVYAATVRFLKGSGHHVVTASKEGLSAVYTFDAGGDGDTIEHPRPSGFPRS